jgi:hypothetical protein
MSGVSDGGAVSTTGGGKVGQILVVRTYKWLCVCAV